MFNIIYLCRFHEGDEETEEEVGDWQQHVSKKKKEEITEVLDRKLVKIRRGRYKIYLVRWKDLSPKDNTWITKVELKELDELKWKYFEYENEKKLMEIYFFD